MNTPNNARIEKIIHNGYQFRFGEYISQGFKISRKAIFVFAAFWVVFFSITAVLDSHSVISGSVSDSSKLLFSLISSCIVSPCLSGSFYWMVGELDRNREVGMRHFFKGFDWAGDLIFSTVIQIGIFVVLMAPLIFFGLVSLQNVIDFNINIPAHRLQDEMWLLTFLIIPCIYLYVSWTFTPFFIIFHGMGAWSAMEASRKIITPKWFVFFAFLIVTVIIMASGIFGLIIGLLFTIPAAICMVYAAFRDVVGMPNENDDDLLDHLIDY